jgi:hypothetical protein
MSALDHTTSDATVEEIRAEAITQLKSARELAKKVRAEAVSELEDARARVRRIAVREEEMAERWAKLLEAENQMKVSATPLPVPTDPNSLIHQAQREAVSIIERAQAEARGIREEAMRLLAVAEGEKAESREIAQSQTERAMIEAQQMRDEAEEEAERLRREAERVAGNGDRSIYSKRGGRKLPRIGDSANHLLSEMSGLRAKSNEEEDRKVV